MYIKSLKSYIFNAINTNHPFLQKNYNDHLKSFFKNAFLMRSTPYTTFTLCCNSGCIVTIDVDLTFDGT